MVQAGGLKESNIQPENILELESDSSLYSNIILAAKFFFAYLNHLC
jgi:hypothetical protein